MQEQLRQATVDEREFMSEMRTSLDLISPELVGLLRSVPREKLLKVMDVVSSGSVGATGLSASEIVDAQVALRQSNLGDSRAREALKALVDELDTIQFDLQDQV